MTAVEIARPGGPEVLRPTRLSTPQPKRGEVLIRIFAAGVNRPDILQRKGNYAVPGDASPLPGLEAAGKIAALGEGVEGFAVGDPVCALLNGGGYAEFAAVPAGQVLSIPAGLSMVCAAALPETVFTVWANLFMGAGLKAGESVLVHGGTSGIGTVAVQLAKARGATVYATAGSPEKVEACQALGATLCVDHRRQDFVAELLTATGGRGVDVVLDMVGGDYLARNMAVAAEDGRIVLIAHQLGRRAEIDLALLMRKRLHLTGSLLRPRTAAQKAAIASGVRAEVWPLLEAGSFRPIIDSVFPLREAAAAHSRLEDGGHVGKVVLEICGG